MAVLGVDRKGLPGSGSRGSLLHRDTAGRHAVDVHQRGSLDGECHVEVDVHGVPSTGTRRLLDPTGCDVFSSAKAVTVTVTVSRRGACPSIVTAAVTVRSCAS